MFRLVVNESHYCAGIVNILITKIRACKYRTYYTYSAHIFFSEDRCNLTDIRLKPWKLLRIEDFCLTNKRNATEWERRFIGCRQLARVLQDLEQMFTNRGVGAIGSDQDVAVVLGAISAPDKNFFIALIKRDNFLTQKNVLFGNLALKQLLQIWSRDSVLRGATTVGLIFVA